jgi:hypothetical protein
MIAYVETRITRRGTPVKPDSFQSDRNQAVIIRAICIIIIKPKRTRSCIVIDGNGGSTYRRRTSYVIKSPPSKASKFLVASVPSSISFVQ